MLIDQLKQEKATLQAIASQAQARLEQAPEGKLRISSSPTRMQHYWVKPDATSTGSYLSAKDTQLAASLAQKEYDEKVLALAEKQIRAIDNLLNNSRWGLDKHSLATVIDTLHPHKQKLVQPYALTDEAFSAQWQNVQYQGKAFAEGAPLFLTDRGERVRSKSEAIISHSLLRYSIPYHYEKPLRLADGVIVYPDFTVLNVRTRQEFFWEHLGMLDDEGYLDRAMGKIELYEKSGIALGKQLIITRETRKRPLGADAIEHAIRQHLL